MNIQELSMRVTRIQREEIRLKKEIWRRIQVKLRGKFSECAQYPNYPIVIFTKLMDNSLKRSWSNARRYNIAHYDRDDNFGQYIGFSEVGIINDVYFGMLEANYEYYTVKHLNGILKQVEKMKFNNIVDFKK